MEIDKTLIRELAAESTVAGTNKRKIACQSRKSAAAIQYLKTTIPRFSGSAVCKEVLETRLRADYPELWAEVEQLVPETRRGIYEWNWRMPKIDMNMRKLAAAIKYMEGPRSRAIVSVYSPRAAVMLEYLRRTETRVSMSEICKRILESELEVKLGVLWEALE